jgi:hypothetical protein
MAFEIHLHAFNIAYSSIIQRTSQRLTTLLCHPVQVDEVKKQTEKQNEISAASSANRSIRSLAARTEIPPKGSPTEMYAK